MGLLDFLKNKPQPETPATSTPAPAPNAAPASTTSSTGGPRYQGAKFTAPAPAAPAPQPRLPEPPPLPFEPTNVLEQLLLLATHDEHARAPFYQALLMEEILMVLAPSDTIQPGEVVLAEGQEIQLQVLSDGKLPIFSSEARLRDGNMSEVPVSFVRVPGQAFFSMTQGQDCVLNPFSPAGKLLPKDEIAALLAGQLTGGAPLGGPEGGEAQVQLTQPEAYPDGLLDALRGYCATNPDIDAAFLAEMVVAHAPEAPRLLLAFHTATPDPSFMQQLGPVLEGKTGGYQFVDLMLLDPNSEEGVNPYFRQIEPVYRKG